MINEAILIFALVALVVWHYTYSDGVNDDDA